MIEYLVKRTLRNKSFHISLLVGCGVSIAYIIMDVWPYRHYDGTPYNMWIESVTASSFQTILFTMMPVIATLAMADTYFRDKESGYLNLIISKGKGASYFKSLFGCNFVFGGLTMAVPLLINIYLCFMILIDRNPDMVTDDPLNMTIFNPSTVFQELYFSHPFIHMLIYVLIGFVTAGILASLSLACSFFLKNRFFVYMSSFVIIYIYSAIASLSETTRLLIPTTVARQTGGVASISSVLLFEGIGLILAIGIYMLGVKKRAII